MEANKKKRLNPKTDCCCMCGDYGLSSELVNCQTCHFRSQHSNVYPKAESYRICNWCLVQEHKTQKNPDSDKNKKMKKKRRNDQDHGRVMIEEMKKKKKKKMKDFDDRGIINHDVGRHEISRRTDLDHRPMDKSRPADGGDRVAVGVGCGGGGGAKGGLSRKAQVNVSSNKGGVRKSVRRYKFLDEVSASKLQI